ncbi:DUF2842 domain-containing protein [Parerythrobacter jejuensis]|uniref:DUF2842 domain-containing protein n=1 Tax=Parerythrobacter jejuensis TaxID=795812 RepID=A0A845APG9_9SPHN|nr:DUF2842 domain-containing protein [Parerythrobacter jejuensis]MXP32190.1 DUF2842 domain-containing protein [Parerythrobacter jejuensis]
MRDEPTWRIPVGMLAMIIGLTIYAIVIARYVPDVIGDWHALLQTVVYLFFGVVWLLPLRRFMIWMEAGRSD